MSTYEILTLADRRGYRLSLGNGGVWYLIRKTDRHVITIGYNVIDALAHLGAA